MVSSAAGFNNNALSFFKRLLWAIKPTPVVIILDKGKPMFEEAPGLVVYLNVDDHNECPYCSEPMVDGYFCPECAFNWLKSTYLEMVAFVTRQEARAY